jgi:hypothetical protein
LRSCEEAAHRNDEGFDLPVLADEDVLDLADLGIGRIIDAPLVVVRDGDRRGLPLGIIETIEAGERIGLMMPA